MRRILQSSALGLVIVLFAAFFVAVTSWTVYVLLGSWPKLIDAIGVGLLIVIGIIFYLRGENSCK